MSYSTEDFIKMENLQKKYPKGVKCDWCKHYNYCPYPEITDREMFHNCCDFENSNAIVGKKKGKYSC